VGFNLMPKNDSYFDDFDEAVAFIVRIARAVEVGLSSSPIDMVGLQKVFELEAEADKVTSRCLSRLDASFVTPIEREDIQRLITGIDDVADHYEGFVTALDVYGITEPKPELVRMAAATRELCEALVQAVSSIRGLDPVVVRGATSQAKRLEDQVDGFHREALRTLFQARPDAYTLVAWKDLFDRLEDTSDKGREVALTVEHILVRHS